MQCPSVLISRKHASVQVVRNRLTIICEHNNGMTIDNGTEKIQLQKRQKFLLKIGLKVLFGSEDNANKWYEVVYSEPEPPLYQLVGRGRKRKNSNRPEDATPTKQSRCTASTSGNSNNNNSEKENAEDGRKSCIMGVNCNNRRNEHFNEFAHPGDADFTVDRRHVVVKPGAPRCRYGKKCIRTNADHWEEFFHDD